jgi:hypothetical protein
MHRTQSKNKRKKEKHFQRLRNFSLSSRRAVSVDTTPSRTLLTNFYAIVGCERSSAPTGRKPSRERDKARAERFSWRCDAPPSAPRDWPRRTTRKDWAPRTVFATSKWSVPRVRNAGYRLARPSRGPPRGLKKTCGPIGCRISHPRRTNIALSVWHVAVNDGDGKRSNADCWRHGKPPWRDISPHWPSPTKHRREVFRARRADHLEVAKTVRVPAFGNR